MGRQVLRILASSSRVAKILPFIVGALIISKVSGISISSENSFYRSPAHNESSARRFASVWPLQTPPSSPGNSLRLGRYIIFGQETTPINASRENKMNDLFNLFGNEISAQAEQQQTNGASSALKQHQAEDEPKSNSILISPTDLEEPLGLIEMMKSNHNEGGSLASLSFSSNGAQNSRHYSSNYKPNYAFSGGKNQNFHQPSHYLAHHPHPHHSQHNHHGQTPLGVNQYQGSAKKQGYNSNHLFLGHSNLNYIHGFQSPMKPPSAQQQAATSGIVPLPSVAYPQQASVGLVSSYISASSALSAIASAQHQHGLAASKQQEQVPLATATTTMADINAIDVDNIEPISPPGLPVNESAPAELPDSSICGRQQVPSVPGREPRIVGGNSTYEGEFPWAVSIQRHGNHHCGGVIIGRRWILTAAHCVRSQLVGNLLVRTGGHTLQRVPKLDALGGLQSGHHTERDYSVEQIVMHDDFNRHDNLQPANGQQHNSLGNMMKSAANTANNADIALLKLKNEIQLNHFAWPVCFPSREAGNFSGHDAIVIGWGKLSEKSEEFSNELQKVKLTIIDNKLCQSWFRQAGREMPIDERIICAGFKQGGKDACHGDSGGPLLSRMANGQYVVVGVVSTGIGCARPLLPGLYSRVSSYINWVERHIAVDGRDQ